MCDLNKFLSSPRWVSVGVRGSVVGLAHSWGVGGVCCCLCALVCVCVLLFL